MIENICEINKDRRCLYLIFPIRFVMLILPAARNVNESLYKFYNYSNLFVR